MRNEIADFKPAHLTRYVQDCQYFKDLLQILTSCDHNQFNFIHVSAIFSCWAKLWKQALNSVKDPQTDLLTQREYQTEIKLMEDHLQGETFALLVNDVYAVSHQLEARQISTIANAISHFPLSPVGIKLLINIAKQVVRELLWRVIQRSGAIDFCRMRCRK